jgi:lysophospholipase L1-like esterase
MKENMKYDTHYYQLREMVLNRMLEIIHHKRNDNGIVFYGDSLTQLCDLNQYYHYDNIYNCGICGITSDILLNFIDEGVIKYKPSKVVIMVGVNDLGNTLMSSPRQIALNIKEMCEIIHNNLPSCQIYVCGCIPCIEEYHGYKYIHKGIRSNDTIYMITKEINKLIQYNYVTFIDTYSLFINDKEVRKELYTDGLHINDEGYKILSNEINKYL